LPNATSFSLCLPSRWLAAWRTDTVCWQCILAQNRSGGASQRQINASMDTMWQSKQWERPRRISVPLPVDTTRLEQDIQTTQLARIDHGQPDDGTGWRGNIHREVMIGWHWCHYLTVWQQQAATTLSTVTAWQIIANNRNSQW